MIDTKSYFSKLDASIKESLIWKDSYINIAKLAWNRPTESKSIQDYLYQLWMKSDNGVATIKQGIIPRRYFENENFRECLLTITDNISKDSSVHSYLKCVEIMEEAKRKGLVNRNYRASIKRVFAAFYPEKFTSIVNNSNLESRVKFAEDYLGFKYHEEVNGWYDRSTQLRAWIKEHSSLNDPIEQAMLGWNISILPGDEETRENNLKSSTSKSTSVSKNVILYGPPGTGKTYLVRRMAALIIAGRMNEACDVISDMLEDFEENCPDGLSSLKDQFVMTTFHQSYSYEDFIEGLTVETENGKPKYVIKDGIFKKFCEEARQNKDRNYVFVIDEINRGNISRIFGELITLIEDDKREGESESLSVTLPYSKKSFSVPPNVFIIATMNTADRSLTSMDAALRRRFQMIRVLPQPSLLSDKKMKGNKSFSLEKMLKIINERLEILLDEDHQIGHALFMRLPEEYEVGDLARIFNGKILPLLEEYFYGDYEKIPLVLGEGFYKKIDPRNLFGEEVNMDLIWKRDELRISSELTYLNIMSGIQTAELP